MTLRSAISALMHARPLDSCIDPDETVVFFPTCASLGASGCWCIPIHGWIYHPAEFSRVRRLTLHAARRLVKLRFPGADLSTPLFQLRAGAFLADNERNSRVEIELGLGRFTLKKSRPDGHFFGQLELPRSHIDALLQPPHVTSPQFPRWLTFRAVTRSTDSRCFDGRILFLPPRGLSVISDIDDTVKITEVADRRRMLNNTFLREFVPVPRMPQLYHHWAGSAQAAFHYISASPWHLYPFLAEFLSAQGFPGGTFHLRDFRLMPRNLPTLLRSSRRVKLRYASELMVRYPGRKFILVGDSGESDPVLYAGLARRFPRQIQQIYIRNVTVNVNPSPRFRRALSRIPAGKCRFFNDPQELMQ